ncbi:glyoxal oxidase precursor [Zalerion maritima]|uniref:Glyoxal oxidase n=1 Tax=Zalerion maritima TaxID=339359 RepID=A0AAD5WUC7_9PEZI|nr:glyoxal oxidase precursor [Zalerion maritima]
MAIRNLVVAAFGLATTVNGFWRMECPGMTGLARVDPLVSPGEASTHVHALFGAGNLGFDSTADQIRDASCTSCAVPEDKSGYWQPALYFEHANGSIEYVSIQGDNGSGNAGLLAYYNQFNDNGTTESGIEPFPEGFRMIAGFSSLRSAPVGWTDAYTLTTDASIYGGQSQDVLQWAAIGFNCLFTDNRDAEPSFYRHYLPSIDEVEQLNCEGGLRTEIVFPSCWNGDDFNESDIHAHVKYPDLSETGACPEGYDTRLPTLMYEVVWEVASFIGMEGRLVLSNGDSTGFGMHADFINGWNQTILENALDQCHSESGQIRDCPVFDIVDKEIYEACKLTLPDAIADEQTFGLLSGLPGGVAITEPGEESDDPLVVNNEPEISATGSTDEPSTSAAQEPSTEAVESTVTPTPTPSSDPVINEPAATTEPPEPVDESISYSVVSTQYSTEGNKVYEIVWEEAWVYVTEELTSTVTVSSGPNKMRKARAKRGLSHHHRGIHGGH